MGDKRGWEKQRNGGCREGEERRDFSVMESKSPTERTGSGWSALDAGGIIRPVAVWCMGSSAPVTPGRGSTSCWSSAFQPGSLAYHRLKGLREPGSVSSVLGHWVTGTGVSGARGGAAAWGCARSGKEAGLAGGSGAAAAARLDSPRHPSYPPGCCSARAQLPTAPTSPDASGFSGGCRALGVPGAIGGAGASPPPPSCGASCMQSPPGGGCGWICTVAVLPQLQRFLFVGPISTSASPCRSSRPVSLCLALPWARCPLPKGLTPPAALKGALGAWGNSGPKQEVGGFRFSVPSDVIAFSRPLWAGSRGAFDRVAGRMQARRGAAQSLRAGRLPLLPCGALPSAGTEP